MTNTLLFCHRRKGPLMMTTKENLKVLFKTIVFYIFLFQTLFQDINSFLISIRISIFKRITVIYMSPGPLMSVRTIICAHTQPEIIIQNGRSLVIWRIVGRDGHHSDNP